MYKSSLKCVQKLFKLFIKSCRKLFSPYLTMLFFFLAYIIIPNIYEIHLYLYYHITALSPLFGGQLHLKIHRSNRSLLII
ncbi:unnamed protein product [Rotaria socialis]